MSVFEKRPTSQLDFQINWSRWLASGEVLASSEWTAPDGITVVATSFDFNTTTVWVSGGTVDQVYKLINTVTTANNPARIESTSIQIRIVRI